MSGTYLAEAALTLNTDAVDVLGFLRALDDRVVTRSEDPPERRRRAMIRARAGLAVIVATLMVALYLSSGDHLAATLYVVVPLAVGLALRAIVRLVAGERR